MSRKRILIVDDEVAIRHGLKQILVAKDYEVSEAENCEKALGLYRSVNPDLTILDHHLPDGDALEILPKLKRIHPHVPIIVLTGHGTIELAVQAIKIGAEQFLTKPIEFPALLTILERLLETSRMRKKIAVEDQRHQHGELNPFMGNSALIRNLSETAKQLAFAESPILILGETGTGKGVLAKWFHAQSPRREEAFVELNCAGLNREFLESELFGYEKGAYTGAVNRKSGLLEVAHHGSFFLDEIGDMDPGIQPKVLKVLEDKRFHKLGDVQDIQVDVRMIFATHQDLNRLMREDKFRQDLYYRINTFPIALPALRERREDIGDLARGFIENFAAQWGRAPLSLSAAALEKLQRYAWPGNIRELRNVLERAIFLCKEATLGPEDFLFETRQDSTAWEDAADLSLEEVERRHIAFILKREGGRVEKAALKLGISKSALYQKIKIFGLET